MPNTTPIGADALPDFNDARVKLVYELLCECDETGKPEEDHWEGWVARKIVAALATQAAPDPRTPANMRVNGGALILALNVLRRAGKNEVADELEKTAAPAAQPAVPPGYVLVPGEPSDKMVQAALHIDLSYMPGQDGADRAAVYRAMLAAAPKAAPAPDAVAGFGLRTTPDSGECPWGGIYSARADAERDAGAMRSATGRDWEVVALAEIASPTLAPVSGAAHEWRVSPAYGGEICANCGAVKGTRRGNATCGEVAAPTTQAAPAAVAEPVAWLHDDPQRYDVIHAEVKDLLVKYRDAAGHLHRPLDKSEHYTIPLYAAPTTQAAAAQGDALDTVRLNWLEGVEGRFYNIDRISAVVGTGFLTRTENGTAQISTTLRAAIDAARAAKKGDTDAPR